MKPPKKSRFPHTVRRGSVAVTVYRVKNSGTASGYLFQVVWSAGGIRRRKSFSDSAEAIDEATLQAELLAAGKVAASQETTTDDLQILSEARRLCGSVPVLAALQEWQKARETCGGELLPAARLWRDTHADSISEPVTVNAAVERFLKAKETAGVDTGASYEHVLGQLKQAFGETLISTVSAKALQTWLDKVKHPVTRNTYRKRVVALFRWCRKTGLLPRVAETEAERTERAREPSGEIGILTLTEWMNTLALIRREHPEHLAVLVLAGFAGLRRAELHAQRWSDVHLDRGILRVSAAKRNTPSKRIVHLSPAAVEWLTLCERDGDKVAPPWSLDRIRHYCRTAKPPIPCPENAFRHSFISYRCAATGNVAETALEAGNSPAIVHRHYRELVAKSDGEAWFNVTPATIDTRSQNVTQFPAAG